MTKITPINSPTYSLAGLLVIGFFVLLPIRAQGAGATCPVIVPVGHICFEECLFDNSSGTFWYLQGDCTVTETILVDPGVALDGRPDGVGPLAVGYTITAADPPDGNFLGAVIKNKEAGTRLVKVQYVGIDTDELASFCPSNWKNRLRGIWLEGVTGRITGNTVKRIKRVGSTCREGNAIEVSNFDAYEDRQWVAVEGNTVEDYQQTGILANYNVEVAIRENTVVGLGLAAVPIAQNGIQLGFGATTDQLCGGGWGCGIWGNKIYDNLSNIAGIVSTGILLYEAGESAEVNSHEVITNNDVGIFVAGATNAIIGRNYISDSTYEGIALDDLGSKVIEDTRVLENRIFENDMGVSILGAGAKGNHIKRNDIHDNLTAGILVDEHSTGNFICCHKGTTWAVRFNGDGIVIEGDNNHIKTNKNVEDNFGTGIRVDGDGNVVMSNTTDDNGSMGLSVGGDDNGPINGNSAFDNGGLDMSDTGTNNDWKSNNNCGTSSPSPPIPCP